jgi:hypothetical protein
MILYFALTNCKQFTETLYQCDATNWLFSYFYCKEKDIEEHPTINFFLDSGAFSAKSQNKAVSLKRYIEFIKKFKNRITVYAGLDVIGDSKATKENCKIMKEEGLIPIPTMHRMANFEYLKEIIAEYDYIALGGMGTESGAVVTYSQRSAYLDRCWQYIIQTKPQLKVHGFGCTSPIIMIKYPWFSVDSTSWITGGKFARVFTPHGNLEFSKQGTMTNPDNWEYIKVRRKHDYEQYCKYFNSIGIQVDILMDDYKERNKANVKYFITLQQKNTEKTSYEYQPELF